MSDVYALNVLILRLSFWTDLLLIPMQTRL